MKCILVTRHSPDEGILLKESYQTVKKRIFDSTDFVEITAEPKAKMTLSKNAIFGIREQAQSHDLVKKSLKKEEVKKEKK